MGEEPFELIPELCGLMYNLGWATGTGGGFSMKVGENYYIAPSGVQKERIKSNDIFVLNKDREIVVSPGRGLKLSECTPLFFLAYNHRNSGAVLHSHSQAAVLISMLYENEFRMTHYEMLKGILVGNGPNSYNYYDVLVVPIIENTDRECELSESLEKAIIDYPQTNAVIVRRHGVYIWGPTWQKTKSMAECYHYLFELAIKLKQLGIDPSLCPEDSPYKEKSITY